LDINRGGNVVRGVDNNRRDGKMKVISLSGYILNPFMEAEHNSLLGRDFKVSKNKVIELELDRERDVIVGFDIALSIKEDQGVRIEVALFSINIRFRFYDTRHYEED